MLRIKEKVEQKIADQVARDEFVANNLKKKFLDISRFQHSGRDQLWACTNKNGISYNVSPDQKTFKMPGKHNDKVTVLREIYKINKDTDRIFANTLLFLQR